MGEIAVYQCSVGHTTFGDGAQHGCFECLRDRRRRDEATRQALVELASIRAELEAYGRLKRGEA